MICDAIIGSFSKIQDLSFIIQDLQLSPRVKKSQDKSQDKTRDLKLPLLSRNLEFKLQILDSNSQILDFKIQDL